MAEKIVHGQQVCKGCKYESLFFCNKYQKKTVSMCLYSKRYQIACSQCKKEKGREEGLPLTTIKKPEKIGYFHLPGTDNLNIYASLIAFKKNYPEACYLNREISEIYGGFDGTIWNGRTPNHGYSPVMVDIEGYRNDIEKLGISLNLTWNNHLVSGTDVYDRTCNAITKIFHNGKHSITVASPELFDYLYKKYPNFTYYQSVITTEKDKQFVKKDPRFNMFLWNRSLNNNWEELLKIPVEERKHLEFLCNDACTPICNRTGHYNYVNSRLLDRYPEGLELANYCTIDHDFMFYNAKKWKVTINTEEIDKYIENGFCHFKLCSRGDMGPVIAIKVIPYIVKPEYVLDAFGWVMSGHLTTEEYKKNQKE